MPSLARSILTVDKADAAPGEELHYTISVMNGSPYTVSGASLVNSIPGHTALIAESLTGATYNAALERIEWAGTLPPADTAAPVFGWIAITGQSPLLLGDDSCVASLDLGFEFEFYGRRYSTISVNSNGQVLFGSCSQAYRNAAIPSPDDPNGFVAPFWDDLIPGNGGVYMATFGTAPNRYAVIEWRDVSVYGQSESQTFEVILYEGSNRVVCQYLDVNGARGMGSSATVGIENQDGKEGTQYLLDGSPAEHALHDGLAIELVHSSTIRATAHTVSYGVRIAERVPPYTIISNTAFISDPYAVHERTVTTTLYAPSFEGSSKTVEPARALPGDTVTYTLRLVNSGEYSAVDTLLTDVLPVEVTYVPGSLVGDGATYNATQRRIEWRGTVVLDAEPTLITYQATLNQGLAVNQRITNTAGILVQGVAMGALQATLVASEINLGTSSKTASASEVVAGAPITYTITLRNSGLAAATSVTLSDPLPSELQLAPDSLEGATYDSDRRQVLWTGSLGPGSEHIIQYRADTDLNTPNGTRVTNTATLNDGHGTTLSLVVVTRVLRGDLSRSDMSVNPTWLIPGGTVMVTVRLRNTGAVAIGGHLHYIPPTPLSIVAGSAYASSGAVSQPGQELEWNGDILPQAMVIVRFQVTAPPGTPVQAVRNEATLRDAGGLEHVLGATIIVNPHLTFFAEVHK